MSDKMNINGVEYVKKESIYTSKNENGEEYIMVRTYAAGVWVGYQIGDIVDRSIILKAARNIWYWDGAASLAQLATYGTKKPDKCKFTVVVQKITLYQVESIIPVTEAAKKSIDGVKIWMV